MDTIASISILHDDKNLSVTVEVEEDGPGTTFEVRIKISYDDNTYTNTFKIDPSQNSIGMVLDPTLSGILLCIAACAAGTIMGPLVDCFNKNIKKYIECLKKKGVVITKELAKCIAGCLLKGAIGA